MKKAPIFRQDKHKPEPSPLAISVPEVVLIIGYFLAVWLIPVSWLNTALGEIAFAVTRKINIYLSEYSIAFSNNPKYFIHCHVIATALFPTLLPYLIIKRNGGRISYSSYWRQRNEQFGGWILHLIISLMVYGFAHFTMLGLVDYPLTRGEWGVWIGGIAPTALMLTGTLGIGAMQIYMIIFSNFSKSWS